MIKNWLVLVALLGLSNGVVIDSQLNCPNSMCPPASKSYTQLKSHHRKHKNHDNVFLGTSEGFTYDQSFMNDNKVSVLNHFVQ